MNGRRNLDMRSIYARCRAEAMANRTGELWSAEGRGPTRQVRATLALEIKERIYPHRASQHDNQLLPGKRGRVRVSRALLPGAFRGLLATRRSGAGCLTLCAAHRAMIFVAVS